MLCRLSPRLLAFLALPYAVRGLAYVDGPKKEFSFGVTWSQHNPVGISREMFLINGQSPGPVIEVDQGDWVVVRVQNDSPFNVTIHFHGIEMFGTPWSDGVPGVTQRPIQPSGSFVYEFQARQQGSYWYHAHYRGQIEDGFIGAMVIHPQKSNPRPFALISNDTNAVLAMEAAEREVRPLLISDWSHLTSDSKWDITLASHIEVSCYDALLFNGKGSVGCLAENDIKEHISSIQQGNLDRVPGSYMTDKGCLPADVMGVLPADQTVVPNASAIPHGVFSGCVSTEGEIEVIRPPGSSDSTESWVAIDIIGATNFIKAAISIDQHDMWVYAVDGSYIEPQKVQAVIIASGERYSVLVKTAKPGDFKIRANSISVPQMITGYALLSVNGTTEDNVIETLPHMDIVGRPTSPDVLIFSDDNAVPFPPRQIPESADALHIINIHQDGSTYLWALNSTRLMPADFEDETPILLDPNPQARDNVTITTRNGTWVDLVFVTARYPNPSHPIHKHGNKMYRIGSGNGPFKWASVDEAIKEKPDSFNLVNPPRRDSFVSPAARVDISWMVVRYEVASPGAWLLHCHISNHMMGGMSMVIQDGIDAWPEVPPEYQIL